MKRLAKAFLPALLVFLFGSALMISADPDPGTGLPTPGVDPPFDPGGEFHSLANGTWILHLGAADMILDAFDDPFVTAAGFDSLLFSEALPLYSQGVALEDQAAAAFDAGNSSQAHLLYLAAQLAFTEAYQTAQEIMEMAWYFFGGGY